MKGRRIIFIYDYFYPDFTAGGPITALGNLGNLVNKNVPIQVLTSSFEYKSGKQLASIERDSWGNWGDIPVWYASNWKSVVRSLESLRSETITLYLNGIFSWKYFLLPLWLSSRFNFEVIISPRGMLQSGALRKRRVRKEVYIFLLKITGLLKGVIWHATDEQELIDVKKKISKNANVVVIPDVPLVSNTDPVFLEKQPGTLKLVYFSLITEKKNLRFILELLNTAEFSTVRLDIIGPIKDKGYWERCKQFISEMVNAQRIIYKGDVTPDKVQKILPNYHVMVLSTFGENFGHVIIEMLASWRPVLISDKTPWNDLPESGGESLPLQMDIWREELRKLVSLDQKEFDKACYAARGYYEHKFNFEDLRSRYVQLFSPGQKQQETIFVYDYFYPDFTAGGPIASLGNLYSLLKQEIPLRVITSAYKYEPKKLLKSIDLDRWTQWEELPVWYAKNIRSIVKSLATLRKGQSTTLYLNGIFSVNFFMLPLWLAVRHGHKIIVSPRGMLQSGAMKRGRVKKLIYIKFLRMTGLLRKVVWHATDVQEAKDIVRTMKTSIQDVRLILNVPVVSENILPIMKKKRGELKLVYYSLITEKKNLIFLIRLLDYPGLENITLNIFGPIKDNAYWRKCKRQISLLQNPERVIYGGDVRPEDSIACLSRFHVLVLPTLGENFGHAIIEMLSAARPVLISDKTPWLDIDSKGAGYSVALNEDMWISALMKMLDWDNDTYIAACMSAFSYYSTKFNFEEMKRDYLKLFSIEAEV